MSVKFYDFRSLFNYKRFNWLFNYIIVIFVILILRLLYLQIVSAHFLIKKGDMYSLRVQNISVARGTITDRLGRLLAVNVPAYAIWIDPQEINKNGGIFNNTYNWKKFSDVVSISLEKLSLLIQKNSKEHFLYLARQLDVSIYKDINQLKLPGVYLKKELKRFYPSGCINAHVVGITNVDNRGIEGVEKSFDSYLTGNSGKRIVRKDRNGNIVENFNITDSKSSNDVILSINERLQFFAYYALKKAVDLNNAESGSIVLIDIRTGEILIMINVPSYNPNNLSVVDKSTMRNRSITDVFEPGSTVKPIVIMSALQHKIIDENSVINTLPYIIDRYKIKDVVLHDKLTVTEVLQKSSNVGVSRLALSMPASVLLNSYKNCGMGRITDIGLIGEHPGIYPRDDKCWSKIERITFSYGYGLMVTPLQLAKVYAIIGGMGISRPLSIIKVDVNNICANQVFPRLLVQTLISMMESVALPGEGGFRAAIKGYRVAVKTGTTKKVSANGHYINRYIACTAGVAPASHPRFALVVVINDPKKYYYGGVVSAPVFSSVMGHTLKAMNVVPDSI